MSYQEVSLANFTKTNISTVWISDSACTIFVTCRKDWLHSYQEIRNEKCQTAHSDHMVALEGKGTLLCRMNGVVHIINDVLFKGFWLQSVSSETT